MLFVAGNLCLCYDVCLSLSFSPDKLETKMIREKSREFWEEVRNEEGNFEEDSSKGRNVLTSLANPSAFIVIMEDSEELRRRR